MLTPAQLATLAGGDELTVRVRVKPRTETDPVFAGDHIRVTTISGRGATVFYAPLADYEFASPAAIARRAA